MSAEKEVNIKPYDMPEKLIGSDANLEKHLAVIALLLAADHDSLPESSDQSELIDQLNEGYMSFKNKQVIVAETEAGDIVGAAAQSTEDDARVCDLDAIAVSDDVRGYGIGRRLMQRIEIDAANNGVNRVRLYPQADSKLFYEKLGYSRNDDEGLYEKRL